MIARRNLLTGFLALGVAPAIVRAGSLMPVRAVRVIIQPRSAVWRSMWWNGSVFVRPGVGQELLRAYGGILSPLTSPSSPSIEDGMNTMRTTERLQQERQQEPARGDVRVFREYDF